jgi:hypothetical protein
MPPPGFSKSAANPGLPERELLKRAALAAAIAEALRRRGVPDTTARLTAEAGMTAFTIAFARWIDESDERTLSRFIRESLDQLKAVIAGKDR